MRRGYGLVAALKVMQEQAKRRTHHQAADEPPQDQGDDADHLRLQLSQTLESLAQRKQKVVEVAHEVTHSPIPLVLAGTGAVVALVGGGWLIAHKARKRLHPALPERLHAAVEVFRHPERAGHPEQRPLAEEIGRAAVVSLSSLLLTQLAKYAMKHLTQSQAPKKEALPEL